MFHGDRTVILKDPSGHLWVFLTHVEDVSQEELQRRRFRIVDVPRSEFDSMGPNVLALSPGRCLMLEGNPVTQHELTRAGCQVLTYRGDEISRKAEGGPTCLTRPILRAEP